jgi:putative phosphoribosyl transferase
MGRVREERPTEYVRIPVNGSKLEGTLTMVDESQGLVIFAHGSGSSRFSPRNRFVAGVLQRAGFGTLLVDLLSRDEELVDEVTAHLRFDVELLAARVVGATDWAQDHPATRGLRLGYFGASTGAAAALTAATRRPTVGAIVSRGGRPDLAAEALPSVRAPTLLIVGARDSGVIELNQQALEQLSIPQKQLLLIPQATHLFEEPGALNEVARLAAEWFELYLN